LGRLGKRWHYDRKDLFLFPSLQKIFSHGRRFDFIPTGDVSMNSLMVTLKIGIGRKKQVE
jgi:hypothetical protein